MEIWYPEEAESPGFDCRGDRHPKSTCCSKCSEVAMVGSERWLQCMSWLWRGTKPRP